MDAGRRKNKISNEVRSLVIRDMNNGNSAIQVGQQFRILPNTVRKIYATYKRTNELEKRAVGHRPRKLTFGQADEVCNWIDEDCTLTLRQIKNKLLENYPQLQVSSSTIYRAIKEFHYSVKRVSFIPERRNSPETLQSRFEYAVQYNRIMIEREKIFFIDEFGIQINSRRSYGRAPKNCRANKIKAQLRGRNYSIAAAMCTNSLYIFTVQDRPYNIAYFGQFLTNLIEHLHEDEIIGAYFVLDNVRFHRTEEIQQLIRNHGHVPIFLPPYSPFLNPIEELFNQWKGIIRSRQPNNEDELYASVHNASEMITRENCQNYVRHMETYLGDCLNRSEIFN
jgi:Transposase and inactivated derivatives